MTREWKAGDAAMVTAANRRTEYRAWFDGETWRQYGAGLFCVNSPTTIRPLVVIDPEDREAVERLRDLMDAAYYEQSEGELKFPSFRRGERGNALAAALREYADPKPPKPEEPQGLGAVVEDAEGRRWTRAVLSEPCCRESLSGAQRKYADIDAVRKLSEGVQP